MTFDDLTSFIERHYDDVQPNGTLLIRKGLVDRKGRYKIIVNSGDHEPPHIHVALNNNQIGSYHIETGLPYRVHHKDTKIDSLVAFWFKNENNRAKAVEEWQRSTGAQK